MKYQLEKSMKTKLIQLNNPESTFYILQSKIVLNDWYILLTEIFAVIHASKNKIGADGEIMPTRVTNAGQQGVVTKI